TDVEPGRGGGDSADRRANRRAPSPESAGVRDHDRRRRQLFLPHAAGARVPDGLRSRTLPVRGFRARRRAVDGADLHARHAARAKTLAAAVTRAAQANAPGVVFAPNLEVRAIQWFARKARASDRRARREVS